MSSCGPVPALTSAHQGSTKSVTRVYGTLAESIQLRRLVRPWGPGVVQGDATGVKSQWHPLEHIGLSPPCLSPVLPQVLVPGLSGSGRAGQAAAWAAVGIHACPPPSQGTWQRAAAPAKPS